jgi:hypothetical protein
VLGRKRGKEKERETSNGRGAADVWITFRGTKRRGAEGSEEDEQLDN